jgi:MYXO-CTERM domain-containing protein
VRSGSARTIARSERGTGPSGLLVERATQEPKAVSDQHRALAAAAAAAAAARQRQRSPVFVLLVERQ